jgi:hypothetical protein
MELRDALSPISEIRQQMARGQIFRGYRSATTAFSGSLAVLAGIVQSTCIPDPQHHAKPFILLWVAAAMISLVVVGAEMIVRTRRSHSQVQRQLSLLAVEQFMPSVVAGALVTWVFCDFLREQLWILPGLWMILFSLGIFASARLLPRAVFAVGGFYLVCGILTLVAASKGIAFSPWLMAGTFGVGQFSTAMILYTRLERVHE